MGGDDGLWLLMTLGRYLFSLLLFILFVVLTPEEGKRVGCIAHYRLGNKELHKPRDTHATCQHTPHRQTD